MTKLTVICGPTAVGKTDFALSIAKKTGADLISVDSRQVYQGMNIGTGKDIPKNTPFTKVASFSVSLDSYNVGYFTIQNIRLWLCDIAKPNQPFSSAIYKQAFDLALDSINKEQKQVILIGGTGYYLKSIINPPDTMTIPPNQNLRDELEKLSVSQLQNRLDQLDHHRFSSMNTSDCVNPRRLIRAIEVSQSTEKIPMATHPFEVSWVGLTAPKDYLSDRITKRVYARIDQGFDAEVTSLINTYPNFLDLPAGNTLGYQEWGKYLLKTLSREEAINRWTTAEISYAKRQLTWFNKQTNIVWFDITDKTWYAQASEQLER